MADKRELKNNTQELINIRFYENQKRQALTTEELVGDEDENATLVTKEIKQTSQICDTVESNLLPTHLAEGSSLEVVSGATQNTCDNTSEIAGLLGSVVSASSSLAISAPSDKSRKGSVDRRIWNLVNLINKEKDSFFTTSSCSGRIILYTWEKTDGNSSSTEPSRLKKGCKWLLVSHDEVKPEELIVAYNKSIKGDEVEGGDAIVGDMYFKMEPCILHVQCRTLTNAKKLVHIATESGFRNSGMVIGKDNRMTVAIRSAMGLQVPLPAFNLMESSEPSPCVSEEYLKYLTEIANAKMRENWIRCDKLTSFFSSSTWS